MSVTPRELLQLAIERCRSPQPVRRRAAISRGYYAAFHAGAQLVARLGIRISKGPAGHGELRARFLNSGDSELVRIGSQLSDLHSKRIAADYKLGDEDVEDPPSAVEYVKDATSILDVFEACAHEPRRGQVTKALKP